MSFHINANLGDIAESVLIPGDPMRAKYIAETFLDGAECYNTVRAMYGYTGNYNNKRVSVQGSGMGMPSLALYVNELINEYKVKTLIRVGTCGAIREDLKLGQVILVVGASGDSSMNQITFGGLDYCATSNFALLSEAHEAAQRLKIDTIQGNIFSTDDFYGGDENRWNTWAEHGVLAAEMESQMLFTLGAKFNARCLSILTVSDNIITGESTTAMQREQTFTDMMKIALEIA